MKIRSKFLFDYERRKFDGTWEYVYSRLCLDGRQAVDFLNERKDKELWRVKRAKKES